MDQGFIKLYRKSIDSGLMQDHKTWAFWCWCLMKASWKNRKETIRDVLVELNPGEFVMGRKSAAKALKLSERSIRTCISKLVRYGNVTTRTTNRFTVISIINWEAYQLYENKNDQQNDQHPTSIRPASDHEQEVKEVKEQPKKKNKKEKIVIPEWIDREAWNGYLETRKANKFTMTDRALKLLVSKLEKFKNDGFIQR